MVWRISFRPSALRELEKLPRDVQRRVLDRLEECRQDPWTKAVQLKVGRSDRPLWRYRVGTYRIVCDIETRSRTVLVLRVAHRREVYR